MKVNREQLHLCDDWSQRSRVAANRSVHVEADDEIPPVRQSQREAAFVCVLVALRHAADPEPLVATGRWPLTVLDAAQGGGGFGYDPIVRPRGASAGSVATLTEAEKNAHSHRALAMRQLVAQLRERWLW